MQQFTFTDIETIAKRLGLKNVHGQVWEGIDAKGNYRRTVIHTHVGGRNVPTSIVQSHVKNLSFNNVLDMYNFLENSKRKR